MIGGDDCLGAVGAHLFVAAVVEKDYVTAANLLATFAQLPRLAARSSRIQ